MKVLVVLGVWLLVAVCAAKNLPEGRDYCCGRGIKGVPPSAWKDKCVSLLEMTDIMMKETKDEIEEDRPDLEITPDLQIQIKINSLSKATIRCVPNNEVYANVHLLIDDLNNIIGSYPTPRNVLKNITEAEAMLEIQLTRLQLAVSDAGPKLDKKLRTRIEEFAKASEEKAVKLFEHNLEQAESSAKVFTSIGISELVDKLVEGIHTCIPIKKTDFDATFKCRRNVKSVVSDIMDKARNLRKMGQLKYVAPEKSLPKLMMDITAEGRGLEDEISNANLQREFLDKYKGFLP